MFIEFQCLHISPTFQIIRLVRPTRKLHHTDKAWPGRWKSPQPKGFSSPFLPSGKFPPHKPNSKAERRRNRRKTVILCVFNKGSSYVDYYLVDDLKYFSAGYIHGSGRGKWKWQGADWRRVMGKL